jgi:glutamate synthase domain-containing protein 3
MDVTPPAIPALAVNEIRDYQLTNRQLAQLLDQGARRVRLTGVEGHRLLLSGLRGAWTAVIEIEGRAGPELAVDLDAPGLIVVAYGGVGDGAARSARAGSVVVLGDAGAALGYRLAGGVVVAAAAAGPRAGLEMTDGLLILAGAAGRLAGERQVGGRIFALGPLEPNAGHAHRGGRFLPPTSTPDPEDEQIFRATIERLRPWLPPSLGEASWPGR